MPNRSCRTNNTVLLTRRRWDMYMCPLLIAAGLIGMLNVWVMGEQRYLAAPFAVFSLWAFLRLFTPRDGFAAPTIRSTPGAVILLSSCAVSLALAIAAICLDVYVFGHPIGAALKPHQAALFAPSFIALIIRGRRNG